MATLQRQVASRDQIDSGTAPPKNDDFNESSRSMTSLFPTKDLSLLVYPMGAASAIALAIFFTSWWRTGLALLGFAFVALWIAATPFFASWLNWRLESEFPPVEVEKLPVSDVVILLGGVGLDLYNPTNRIMHALQIYRAGKARLIVYSGGNADPLVELGVPRAALVLETKSRNTRENAVNTAAIFKARGWRSGILVTSAAHMPRAIAAFQRVGLSVVPATTGVQAEPTQFDGHLDLQMDNAALRRTNEAIKEIVGLLVYRFLGWA
jgi:uncharacterized SAM-binding protein YcdF (DUF218 family)